MLVPVLRIEPVVTAGPFAVPNALVFTSLQGVRTHRFLPTLSSVPVFAVGERSAQFARSRGYRTVFSADGNVKTSLVHELRGFGLASGND